MPQMHHKTNGTSESGKNSTSTMASTTSALWRAVTSRFLPRQPQSEAQQRPHHRPLPPRALPQHGVHDGVGATKPTAEAVKAGNGSTPRGRAPPAFETDQHPYTARPRPMGKRPRPATGGGGRGRHEDKWEIVRRKCWV